MAAASIGSARCSSSSRVRYKSSSYQGLGFRVQGLCLGPTHVELLSCTRSIVIQAAALVPLPNASRASVLPPSAPTFPPVTHRSRRGNTHAYAHAHTGGLQAGVTCGYVTFWKTASLTRTRCHRLTALRAQRHTDIIDVKKKVCAENESFPSWAQGSDWHSSSLRRISRGASLPPLFGRTRNGAFGCMCALMSWSTQYIYYIY